MPRHESSLARKEEAPSSERRPVRVIGKIRKEELLPPEHLEEDEDAAAVESIRRKIRGEEASGVREMVREVPPPPDDVLALTASFQETTDKLRPVSMEQARRQVEHGDRIWEFVSAKLVENPYAVTALGYGDPKEFGKYNPATEYVRTLAKYKKAAEEGDEAKKTRELDRLGVMNDALGIEGNAIVQSVMEKEDLGHAHLKKMDALKRQAAAELGRAGSDYERMNVQMSIGKAKGLVRHPDQLWEQAIKSMKNIEGPDPAIATNLVFAVAAYNEAVRKLDNERVPKLRDAVMGMAHAMGMRQNALLQSEMLAYDETLSVKNPFER